ncbi:MULTISPECIES: ABC transporter permease subunit [unclassified Halomonas]|mgnify:FL=1|uniref:ABC transporter permease subunit n=1 Tax=Halomonas sp. H10-59 TaxID=2950874 RepID=A0AAU7KT30_9GAMM|nr:MULTISPECIES: ABC transporter permease subunit [unclassified Halomonas]MBR9772110.1 ABC transporter permease subunit [Gammaproteobacteria bacterium]MAR74311.1 ABC transporter permease [Halomonas sp.]MBR9882075.1 ABC transporter permease subunit [Gammaproteobacteria bacterium]MBY5942541.1 ABC transporter permease subunit [Halomonas sp. DP5N14-9]MCJ8287759.1 ABC transporter permease subunit [Halomonas sp.]
MKAPLPAWLWLVPFAVIFTAFQLAPMAWVAISAFNVNGDWGLGHFQEIAQSAFFRQAIWKSLTISLVSSAIGLVIATLTCHALVRSGGRLRRAMIAFTNMTSNFAGVPLAFAFIILLGANGVLTLALQRLGIIEDVRLYSTGGLIVIYTWFQIPLGILLLFPAFAGLKAEWRDAASLLGAGRIAYWQRIGLPVLWPALAGTFTVLFANAMGAYATVYALVNTSYNLMTIRIANLVAGDLFLEPNLASALALILVLLLVLVTLVQQWLLRRSAQHGSR